MKELLMRAGMALGLSWFPASLYSGASPQSIFKENIGTLQGTYKDGRTACHFRVEQMVAGCVQNACQTTEFWLFISVPKQGRNHDIGLGVAALEFMSPTDAEQWIVDDQQGVLYFAREPEPLLFHFDVRTKKLLRLEFLNEGEVCDFSAI